MLLLCNVVEQLSTLANFSNEETDAISLPGFEELNDIRVVERTQDVDLVLERLIV